MANEQNLRPCEHKFTQEEAKKGGRNSAKARRERKTIQKILNDYLDADVSSNKNMKKLADSVGIKGEQSIKELTVAMCLLNTLQKGDVDKLQKLCEILGEDNGAEHLEDISEAEADVFGDD